MPSRGFLFDLMDQLENGGRIHQELLTRAEALTGRTLVVYFANSGHPGGAMVDADPDLLENVLRSLPGTSDSRKLDLMIASPGGSPFAAEKIVRVCRAFSTDFRTIVMGRAMSAATLLCLGSDKLVMGETASLGPIDPQMLQQTGPNQQRLVAAGVIIRSFEAMLDASQKAIKEGQPADPFLHVLGTMDARAVFEAVRANDATSAIAKHLLDEGLLRGKTEAEISNSVESLLDAGVRGLHGKHIFPNSVTTNHGLPVTILKVGTPLDQLLREIHLRTELYATRKGLAKYFVTTVGGVDVSLQMMVAAAPPQAPRP